MQHTRLTSSRRRSLLLFVTILGLFSSLLLTTELWEGGARNYPLVPIIPGFRVIPLLSTLLLAGSAATLSAALVCTRFRGWLVLVGTTALLVLVAADITRLQPWVFHYTAVLLCIAYSFLRPLPAGSLLDAGRILIAGIYVWSGIQKMNLAFMAGIFPWFTEPLWSPFGAFGLHTTLTLGIFVPFLETAFGIGFLFKRTRTLSLFAAAGMLVVVLASIGPFGHDWNSSVWPWNIAIFATALILFYRTDFTITTLWSRSKYSLLAWVTGIVFWIMPLGSFIGVVDHYLAWSLYSGTVPEARLIAQPSLLERISPTASNGELLFVRWVHNDLNVVPYPEPRVFEHVHAQLCDRYPNEPIELQIHTYRHQLVTRECGQ